LPTKKQSLKAKFKSWQLIAAVVSSVALIAGGVCIFAYQQYTQAQISAAEAAETAVELGQQRIEEVSAALDDLELAIQNAEEIATQAAGQTLDEKDPEALLTEIEKAKEIWDKETTRLLELEALVKALRQKTELDTSSETEIAILVKLLNDAVSSNWGTIPIQVASLGQKISSVKGAQALWKEKQEEIAAEEEAKRVAAEQADIARAAAEALARQATETTAIAAPPASSEPVTDSSEQNPLRIAVESYILALATNVTFVWDPDLCEPGFVCGIAAPNVSWTGTYSGPPRTAEDANVFIYLDDSFMEFYYTTRVGVSILVHEAAHARQWLKYGTEIRTANQAYTGLEGDAAIEYMADCATIVKLSYSTGVYTSSCTPSELEAAATLWE
jgi:hypothetical protein